MNQEINSFIEFLILKLDSETTDLSIEVQNYLDDWDDFEYDTEEAEFIVDEMCVVMNLAGVDSSKILI